MSIEVAPPSPEINGPMMPDEFSMGQTQLDESRTRYIDAMTETPLGRLGLGNSTLREAEEDYVKQIDQRVNSIYIESLVGNPITERRTNEITSGLITTNNQAIVVPKPNKEASSSKVKLMRLHTSYEIMTGPTEPETIKDDLDKTEHVKFYSYFKERTSGDIFETDNFFIRPSEKRATSSQEPYTVKDKIKSRASKVLNFLDKRQAKIREQRSNIKSGISRSLTRKSEVDLYKSVYSSRKLQGITAPDVARSRVQARKLERDENELINSAKREESLENQRVAHSDRRSFSERFLPRTLDSKVGALAVSSAIFVAAAIAAPSSSLLDGDDGKKAQSRSGAPAPIERFVGMNPPRTTELQKKITAKQDQKETKAIQKQEETKPKWQAVTDAPDGFWAEHNQDDDVYKIYANSKYNSIWQIAEQTAEQHLGHKLSVTGLVEVADWVAEQFENDGRSLLLDKNDIVTIPTSVIERASKLKDL